MMKPKLIVGLMSGTSLDAVDAVLIRVQGNGARTSFKQLAFVSHAFPNGLRNLLLKNSNAGTSRVDDIARLNFLLAHISADAVRAVARKAHVKLSHIALIGSHGQTIQHLPTPHRMMGRPIRATLQIGDPSVLATLLQITVVGDFRVADVAAGGQGAPLVPYVDWILFRSHTKNRLLLNIGGIANITVLPRHCVAEDVIAFDTGPGNMVVDDLMALLYEKRFDRNGATARRGYINPHLLRWMLTHSYLRKKPPKSTGREEFGKKFIEKLLQRARKVRREDIVATASFFTPLVVHKAYTNFIGGDFKVDELILSGGGSRNNYFVETFLALFGEGAVKLSDQFGVSSQAKEAICFALLANETIAGGTGNLPSVTGARKAVVLGKICKPQSGRK